MSNHQGLLRQTCLTGASSSSTRLPAAARICAGLLLSIGLACCAPDLPDMPAPQDSGYHLGPGDQIRVITYDEPQLSTTFIVGSDGVIEFPLVGRINAVGMTPGGLAAVIAGDLQAGKLLSNPSVSVEVAQYRPISVLGEVNHPGQYPFEPGMTMLDAVALAGGFTYRAVTDHAGDLRHDPGNGGQSVEGNITRGSPLEPGDVVTVYERYF